MKKKHLRRALADAEASLKAQAEKWALAEEMREAELDEQHEAMFAVGYLYVGPNRTAGDRLRAAQRGALLLDDVQIVESPTVSITQDHLESTLFGNYVSRPGRTHHRVEIEFETEGTVVEALGDYIAEHTSARPRRIHP